MGEHMIYTKITQLVDYATKQNLIQPEDRNYAINRLIEALGLLSYEPREASFDGDLEKLLGELCDYAYEHGLIEHNSVVYRDLFDTKLMGLLTPPPSVVIHHFHELYKKSPLIATDDYYRFSRATNYIRTQRVAKDIKWVTKSRWGDIDITINLSKPEKDPKAIAAAKNAPQVGYPKCQLCAENEGYSGHVSAPARQNHRIIPINLGEEHWYLQYSPYVYYNEHCIAFSGQHTPMSIRRGTFEKMLDFVTLFPHYFIGSNADLPIVGGSILSHDHMQGGHYTFAMEKAPMIHPLQFNGFEDVTAGIVDWPMSVIRLRTSEKSRLVDLADKILHAWRSYSDPSAFIFSQTDGEPHSTITPIARRRGEEYELDLVLRNNITTDEYPLGVFHPHAQYHHIKKENIGLIEVMGLAVLPARLKQEMRLLEDAILSGENMDHIPELAAHAPWAKELLKKYTFTKENIRSILKEEIGHVFVNVLCDAGVYKCTEEGQKAFLRFCTSVNES